MEVIQNLSLMTAGELALASFLIGMIVQAVKKWGKVPSNLLPLLAIGIGIVVGLITVAATYDTNYINGAIAGGIIGAATSGLVDVGSGAVNTVKTANAEKQAKVAENAELKAQVARLQKLMQSQPQAAPESSAPASAAVSVTSQTTTGGNTSEA